MIEWVKIEEFEIDPEIDFNHLVCYTTPGGGKRVSVRMHYVDENYKKNEYCSQPISHAARITYPEFPAEKTLEEKFYQAQKDYINCNSGTSYKLLFGILAQIAKEHYEGKE